jgi:hypothetical protein
MGTNILNGTMPSWSDLAPSVQSGLRPPYRYLSEQRIMVQTIRAVTLGSFFPSGSLGLSSVPALILHLVSTSSGGCDGG